jgi:hypothetical protein
MVVEVMAVAEDSRMMTNEQKPILLIRMSNLNNSSFIMVQLELVHPTLVRNASGLRHLRWAREILGSLQAFFSHEACLSEPQRAALGAEIAHVATLVSALSSRVKPYRDFMERTRTAARGALRAAEHLVSGGAGLASPPEAAGARRALDAARNEWAAAVESERRALHGALSGAIDATRAGLLAMDERLAACFSAAFVAALYPPLTPDGMRVLDDGDPDDDAAGGSESQL